MALLMFDGFEACPVGDQVNPPASAPWVEVGAITSSAGRTGQRGARVDQADTRWVTQALGNPVTLFIGMAFLRVDNWHTQDIEMLKIRGNASGLVASLQYLAASREYVLLTGAGTELFRASVPVDEWHYYEVGVTVDGATSSIELRKNGAEVFRNTSVDLEVGANTGVADVVIAEPPGGSSGRWVCHIDDIYLCDGSGTENNDFLGPVRIHGLSPTSDAAVAWAPDSGVDNYARVDDLLGGHDGDTSYVSSSTVGEKDLYGLEDLAAEYQNPVAVQLYWAARHDDSSGGAGMAAVLKSGTTEVEGSEVALSSGYATFAEPIQATNPDTGLAWTPAEINALQIGAVVKANL